MSSVLNIVRLTKISILYLRRDPQKISYEHRAYESVDEKSLSLCHEKKNPGTNGLKLAQEDRRYMIE